MHKLNPITKGLWLALAGGTFSQPLLAADTTEADSRKNTTNTTEPALKP